MNLSLQEVACCSKSIKGGLNTAMDIIQLIKYSPKRQITFEIVQEQKEFPITSGIRTLCPTRWIVCTGAIQAIINNYAALQETMELSSHGTDDCSRRAHGMLVLMDKFSTFLVSSFQF